MAFREVTMVEVKKVLWQWLAGVKKDDRRDSDLPLPGTVSQTAPRR